MRHGRSARSRPAARRASWAPVSPRSAAAARRRGRVHRSRDGARSVPAADRERPRAAADPGPAAQRKPPARKERRSVLEPRLSPTTGASRATLRPCAIRVNVARDREGRPRPAHPIRFLVDRPPSCVCRPELQREAEAEAELRSCRPTGRWPGCPSRRPDPRLPGRVQVRRRRVGVDPVRLPDVAAVPAPSRPCGRSRTCRDRCCRPRPACCCWRRRAAAPPRARSPSACSSTPGRSPGCRSSRGSRSLAAALVLVGVLLGGVRVHGRGVGVDPVRLVDVAAVALPVHAHGRVRVAARGAAALPVPRGLNGQRAGERALLVLRGLPDRLDPVGSVAAAFLAALILVGVLTGQVQVRRRCVRVDLVRLVDVAAVALVLRGLAAAPVVPAAADRDRRVGVRGAELHGPGQPDGRLVALGLLADRLDARAALILSASCFVPFRFAAVASESTLFDCDTCPSSPSLPTRTGVFVLLAPIWNAPDRAIAVWSLFASWPTAWIPEPPLSWSAS